MNQDFSLWKHQIRLALGVLCDVEFQSSACWVGANGGGDALRKAIHFLYEESQFDQFLAFQAWRQAGLDETTGQELQALQQQLDTYDEPDSDAAILADPSWQAIFKQARKVMALLV